MVLRNRPARFQVVCRVKQSPIVETDDLLAKCEDLLDVLYANPEHAKLRALVTDIEELRDRLLAQAEVGRDDTDLPRR
jgi:hypothetical protein